MANNDRLPGETYEEWLIRRTREAVTASRLPSPPGEDAIDRELRLARNLGELIAHASALCEALASRHAADAEARTRG
jgi:hypothetical protein